MTNFLFAPPTLGTNLALTGLPGGGNKIQDRSFCANPGTITGATWKRLPSGLWYLSFDGNDDLVTIPHHPNLQPTDAITIKFWLKPVSLVDWDQIFGKTSGDPWSDGYGAYVFNSGGYTVKAWVNNYTVNPLSLKIDIGKWQHVVITYNRAWGTTGALRGYVNAVPATPANATAQIGANTANLLWGKTSSGGYYFDGAIVLAEIIPSCGWSALDARNSFDREKHLFGVW